ncbi:gfo/Idh/MocA family oxidoreductase [Opitutaceae bacterium TAV3]|nr:gfo/Idh/MocA family oxidoreductase [Opitutaceae bacterium TAV3]
MSSLPPPSPSQASSPATIRGIAAIGAGHMGIEHVTTLASDTMTPRWRLLHICDLSPERLQLAREIAPQATAHTSDLDSLFNDPDVAAVSINTPSAVRPQLILRALAAGKHVLCEKPLAPTPAAASRLAADIARLQQSRALAGQPPLLLTCNLFSRNLPWLRRAHDLIRDGAIGRLAILRVAHCTPKWKDPARLTRPRPEGHTLHNCGMHYIDLIRWLADADFTEDATCRATRFWGGEHELHFMVQGRMSNGCAYDLHNSFCYTSLAAKPRNWSLVECIGTRGTITVRHDFHTTRFEVRGNALTLDETYPYESKQLPVYYADFAQALDTGDLGRLPRIEDAVIASEFSQRLVDQALANPIPNFGDVTDFADTQTIPTKPAISAS